MASLCQKQNSHILHDSIHDVGEQAAAKRELRLTIWVQLEQKQYMGAMAVRAEAKKKTHKHASDMGRMLLVGHQWKQKRQS